MAEAFLDQLETGTDGTGHFAVSLYNHVRPQPRRHLIGELTEPQVRQFQLSITTKREIPIRIVGPVEADDYVQVCIEPADGLSRGQLTIDAPELLNGITWCIQLPRQRFLNRGLVLAISRPGLVQEIAVQYTAPNRDSVAFLHIAMPAPPEQEQVGIMTYELGTQQSPIFTEMNSTDPQAQLMIIARALAFNGAYSRLTVREDAEPAPPNL